MSVEETKCCNEHTREKKLSGECCQLEEQEKAEQDTYEHSVKTETKETHE